jgi:hypothetical protein
MMIGPIRVSFSSAANWIIGVVRGARKLVVVGPSFKRPEPESVPFTEFCGSIAYRLYTQLLTRSQQ